MGGKKTQTQVYTQAKTEAQRNIANNLAGTYLPRALDTPTVYSGQRVAGLDPLQTAAISGSGQFVPTFNTVLSRGDTNPLAGDSFGAAQKLLSGEAGARPLSESNVTDFFNRTVADPTRRAFTEHGIPAINEGFAGPGFFGSARGHAIADQYRDMELGLSETAANMQMQNLLRNQDLAESDAARSLAAIPVATELGASNVMNHLRANMAQLGGLQAIFGFGEAAQTQEQAQLFAELEAFAEEQNLTGMALDIVMAVLNESIMQSTTQKVDKPRLGRNTFELAGAKTAGAMLGGYGAAFANNLSLS